MGNVQPGGGTVEVQLFRAGHKIFEVAEFHKSAAQFAP